MKHFPISLLLASLLVACSPGEDKPAQTEVVEAVQQPLDKAKGVEQQIMEGAEAQRKQADEL